ncbi:unnamed protein product [Trifolium pratense]|uniref:Uncharacterized protein n=1 Tax=Trifolium pratense TaxID=57577 RepID=A0ACB0KH47_TRIPR|nr:unnamed protein product [Trifolium pratense]
MALKIEIILLIFVCGTIILGGNDLKIVDGKVCQFICDSSAAYMTCPSSGDQHVPPSCNCCFASTGCTIYRANGIPICTAK